MHQNSFMTRRNPRELKKESQKDKSNFFKYGSLFLAGAIPAFYLFGLRFYEGVLTAYGVSQNSLSLDTLDIYVSGYFAVAHLASDYLKLFATIMSYGILFFLGSIALLFLYRVLSSKQSFLKIVHFFKLDDINDKLAEKLFRLYEAIMSMLSLLGALAILWILVPQWAYTKGKATQKQSIEDYSVKGCYYDEDGWNSCTQILDQNSSIVYEGLLVAIKGDKVALYQKNGSQVITLQSDQKLYRPKKFMETNSTK